MLEARDLDAGYGDVQILRGVSIRVEAGEIVALVGANGAGKTTLLRVISGLVRPRHGSVRLQGADITGWPPYRLVGVGLVHVPENRALFTAMSVLENLEMGAYTRASRRRWRETLRDVLAVFPILAERRGQLAGTLSGGEQQMLAIGRGLMARPRLLVLDEPSLGLAPMVVAGIFRTIEEIRRLGTTILLVEQDVKQALRVSDRAYVMENGRIVAEDASVRLRETDLIRRAYMGAIEEGVKGAGR
jgi:branched-chain amino acid transport system ATP-binding protein